MHGVVVLDELQIKKQLFTRSIANIAKELGISPVTLWYRLDKIGIHRSHGPSKGTAPPNKCLIDEVWLREQAKIRSSGDIAKELNLNGRTVRRRLAVLGIDISSNGSKFNIGVSRSPDTAFGGFRNLVNPSSGGKALKGKKYPSNHFSHRCGSESPHWKGGVRKERNGYCDAAYKEWRKQVFERDNYTCQECGSQGGILHADHIKRWKDYPELRHKIENGRTLCAPCHRLTPTYGNRKQPVALADSV